MYVTIHPAIYYVPLLLLLSYMQYHDILDLGTIWCYYNMVNFFSKMVMLVTP